MARSGYYFKVYNLANAYFHIVNSEAKDRCFVAQRKRVGLITQRSEDRNLAKQLTLLFSVFFFHLCENSNMLIGDRACDGADHPRRIEGENRK